MSDDDRASNVNVHIEGNVSGQIAIGDNILQIGDVHGGIVNIIQPNKKPTFTPRPRPVMVRPRKFPGFLDHETELETAVSAIQNGEAVSLHAQEGMGKTTFLRHLAYNISGAGILHGIIFFPAHGKDIDDVLQIIFDHFFESDTAAKPTDAELRQFLQGVQALILLDDPSLGKDEISELINTVPQSVFVLASPERCLWGEGQCIELQGLPLQEALTLIERELNRTLKAGEQKYAETLGILTSGQPLLLIQAAAQVREGQTLEGIVNLLKASKGGLGNIIFAKLNDSQRTILRILDTFKGIAIPQKHLEELVKVSDIKQQLKKLQELRLVQAQGAAISLAGAFSLPMPATGPSSSGLESQALDYFLQWMKQVPPLSEVKDILDLILSLLERAVRMGNWEAVVGLGKGIENVLILSGFWHSWWQVLQWILAAAKSLSDKAVQAWALHQLGTRSLCLGDLSAAQVSLTEALAIRQAIGDQLGMALTNHSLGLTTAIPPVLPPPPPAPLIHSLPAIAKAALTPLTTTLLVGGIAVAVATSVLLSSSRSQRSPAIPPPPIQVTTEKPSDIAVRPPTLQPVFSIKTLASTETLLSVWTEEITQTPLKCIEEGAKIVSAKQYGSETAFAFDFPISISKDLGDNLTVYINSNKTTKYKTETSDPNRNFRLFIFVSDFQEGDEIQIQLQDAQILYCSAVISSTIFYIEPNPTDTPHRIVNTCKNPGYYFNQSSCIDAGCVWRPEDSSYDCLINHHCCFSH